MRTCCYPLDGKESPWYLLITDVALLVLFALFHTGMASRVYKRLLHQFHMVPFIRASYILVTCTLIQVSDAISDACSSTRACNGSNIM